MGTRTRIRLAANVGPHESAPMSLGSRPRARPLEVEIDADSVMSPTVHYQCAGHSVIRFPDASGRSCRVLFENLDALRVCRGEYSPYEGDNRVDSWVSIVDESPWLRERYHYEATWYGSAYEFGGDVNEMLRDFRHYLFHFHDQFVEAIAAGIWIDPDPGSDQIPSDHPLARLPKDSIVDEIRVLDQICRVRRTSVSPDELLHRARLCSQALLEFYLLPESPDDSPSWQVRLRRRDGNPISQVRSTLGGLERELDGLADLADVRTDIETWMRGVHERRKNK